VTAWAVQPAKSALAPPQVRGRVTDAAPDGSTVEFIDTLGKTRTARADLRPKGSGAPVVGETWTFLRSGDVFVLGSLVGHPPPPEITGEVAPGSALAGLVSGLADLGLASDSTTPPPPAPVPSWAALSLTSPWQAYTTAVDSLTPPTPGWSVWGGVAYLRGLVTNSADSVANTPLATLPAAARPLQVRAGQIGFEISTATAVGLVRLDVLTTGEVRVIAAQAADRILTLDRLSWPTW
jgi:hypothetical protein